MRKLDRLVWADGFTFNAYGLRIGIRAQVPWVLNTLQKCLPWGWTPSRCEWVDHLYSVIPAGRDASGRTRRLNLVYADAFRIAMSRRLEDVADDLEKDLSLFVGESARTRVFVHAGVVALGGRAALLPGRSFSGKSTLVEALVRHGATYYSDEFAVLDRHGRVHPYARPIGRRSGDEYKGRPVDVRTLGGRIGRKPLPVSLIVFTRYTQDGHWRPEPVSPGLAVLELIENTLCSQSQPDRVLRLHSALASGTECLRSERCDADEVAQDLVDRLRRSNAS